METFLDSVNYVQAVYKLSMQHHRYLTRAINLSFVLPPSNFDLGMVYKKYRATANGWRGDGCRHVIVLFGKNYFGNCSADFVPPFVFLQQSVFSSTSTASTAQNYITFQHRHKGDAVWCIGCETRLKWQSQEDEATSRLSTFKVHFASDFNLGITLRLRPLIGMKHSKFYEIGNVYSKIKRKVGGAHHPHTFAVGVLPLLPCHRIDGGWELENQRNFSPPISTQLRLHEKSDITQLVKYGNTFMVLKACRD